MQRWQLSTDGMMTDSLHYSTAATRSSMRSCADLQNEMMIDWLKRVPLHLCVKEGLRRRNSTARGRVVELASLTICIIERAHLRMDAHSAAATSNARSSPFETPHWSMLRERFQWRGWWVNRFGEVEYAAESKNDAPEKVEHVYVRNDWIVHVDGRACAREKNVSMYSRAAPGVRCRCCSSSSP